MRQDDEHGEHEDRPKTALRRRTGLARGPLIAAACVGIAGFAWLAWRAWPPSQPPSPAVVASPREAPGRLPDDAAPGLDATADPTARRLLKELCSSPSLASWLATEDLVRRIASAVESVSQGGSPARPLEFLAPPEAFSVREEAGRLYTAPESHARYDLIAQNLAAMDMRRCARAFPELTSQLEAAYREIGPPDSTFAQALARAIGRLTSVAVTEQALALEQHVLYLYADPELERLSAAEKHLLRMGPRNARLVQQKLRELAEVLALPEPR